MSYLKFEDTYINLDKIVSAQVLAVLPGTGVTTQAIVRVELETKRYVDIVDTQGKLVNWITSRLATS